MAHELVECPSCGQKITLGLQHDCPGPDRREEREAKPKPNHRIATFMPEAEAVEEVQREQIARSSGYSRGYGDGLKRRRSV